jgi:hypothetical protein
VTNLLVDKQFNFFHAHPACNHNHEWDIANLHLVCHFIVDTVENSDVVLIAGEVGFGWEGCNVCLLRVYSRGNNLDPVFSMLDFYEPFMSVGLDVDLYYLAEIPHLSHILPSLMLPVTFYSYFLLAAGSFGRFLGLEVNHLSDFQILEFWDCIIAVMIIDKPIQPEAELVCKNEVILPEK